MYQCSLLVLFVLAAIAAWRNDPTYIWIWTIVLIVAMAGVCYVWWTENGYPPFFIAASSGVFATSVVALVLGLLVGSLFSRTPQQG